MAGPGCLTVRPTYNDLLRIHRSGFEVYVAHTWLVCLIVVFALFTGADLVHAQASKMPPMQIPGQGEQAPPGDDEARSKLERDMAKKANQSRQASLKKDTDKLLKLATELKEYVDKTNENMLSMDVIKKADEIEKLAHSVKDKMKGN